MDVDYIHTYFQHSGIVSSIAVTSKWLTDLTWFDKSTPGDNRNQQRIDIPSSKGLDIQKSLPWNPVRGMRREGVLYISRISIWALPGSFFSGSSSLILCPGSPHGECPSQLHTAHSSPQSSSPATAEYLTNSSSTTSLNDCPASVTTPSGNAYQQSLGTFNHL